MNTAIKTNIKHIPTDLNYYYATNKKINRLIKFCNIQRLLILGLLLINLILIGFTITQQIDLNHIHNSFIELHDFLGDAL